jgi:hypothetical protein
MNMMQNVYLVHRDVIGAACVGLAAMSSALRRDAHQSCGRPECNIGWQRLRRVRTRRAWR